MANRYNLKIYVEERVKAAIYEINYSIVIQSKLLEVMNTKIFKENIL